MTARSSKNDLAEQARMHLQPVEAYYDANVEREWSRLDQPFGKIEFGSTWQLICNYFPNAGRICDIGAGPGRYAIELARQGYRLTLFDLSAGLLARARAVFQELGLQAERFIQGSATRLDHLEEAGYDAALLLGPMYHLTEPFDRQQVLQELKRVLRPGGVAVVGYLNSWGILRTGLGDFPDRYRDGAFVRSMLGELSFARELPGFTACYWSTPALAQAELERAGLRVLASIGAEGFAGGMRPFVEAMASSDQQAYGNLLEIAIETSPLPQYRDACEHLQFVVQKDVSYYSTEKSRGQWWI